MSGRLVELEKVGDNLRVVLTAEGRQEIGDLIGRPDAMHELMEWHLCNGWDSLMPDEIGALTGCPYIYSDQCERRDDRSVLFLGWVYWFDRYAVEDPVATLAEKGEVLLTGVVPDIEQLRRKLKEGGYDGFDLSDSWHQMSRTYGPNGESVSVVVTMVEDDGEQEIEVEVTRPRKSPRYTYFKPDNVSGVMELLATMPR